MNLKDDMPLLLDYYDKELVRMICNKYGYSPKEALRKFLSSETYRMLRDPRLAMWEFSPLGVFDMWESEQITGDPRNSLYIRRD
ncbi:MAG: hypothetical protein IKC94_04810 [Lentisphaeria bacterium]|nr:hypothetical protein [Lentisphaeria bacterium]